MAGAPGAQTSDQCVVCHQRESPELVAQHMAGVHRLPVVGCTGCHGGNAAATTQAAGHDPAKGFRGRFSAEAAAELCESCHNDAARMRPFGLAHDAGTLWRASVHGSGYASGDARMPDCRTCHGTHGVLARKNPAAPSHRKRVAELCGSCHSDSAKLAPAKIATDQVQQYLSGVHGRTLMGERDGPDHAVPTCVDCHGAHGMRPFHAVSVPDMCGTCHFEEAQHLRASPHMGALRYTGAPSCVSCHGSHGNSIRGAGFTAENCATCHEDAQSGAAKVASSLGALMANAARAIESANRLAGEAKAADGAKARLVEAQHDDLKRLYASIRKRSHALDVASTQSQVDRLEAGLGTLRALAETDLAEGREFSRTTTIVILASLAGLLFLVSLGLAALLIRIGRRVRRAPAESRS